MTVLDVAQARHEHSPARRLVACLGLALCLSATTAPAAVASAGVRHAEDGSIGIRLLEAPEARRGDPRALVYIVDHVRPGTTIERKFAVTNTTDTRQRVQLYPGPADIVDGQFVGADAGKQSELTSWVSTSLPFVGLAPGEETQQTVTIDVPADAVTGERYGVLWASVRSHGGGQVRLVNRVGIRIYLDVGRGGEPPSDFHIDQIVPGRNDSGQPVLTALITNTGERALDVRGDVRLRRGPGGLNAGPFKVASASTLKPDEHGEVEIALDKDLPAGPWRATFDLRSGEVEHRSSATVTFPDAGQGAAVTASDDDGETAGSWWAQPWVLALLALGLALLLLLLAALARRRRRERLQSPTILGEPGEVTPTGGTR